MYLQLTLHYCFQELHDAPTHPVLSLLAATVLFVLSQDRLNMDLDTESLKLILALTKADSACAGNEHEFSVTENVENIKNRKRVMQLCSEMQARGKRNETYYIIYHVTYKCVQIYS